LKGHLLSRNSAKPLHSVSPVFSTKRLVRSFVYAFGGIYAALKSEQTLRVHALCLAATVWLGFYLGISPTSWALVVFAIGAVLSAELFNTAIERLSDEISGGKHSNGIKQAKDISAAAVLLSAIAAAIIGVLVIVMPLLQRVTK
jgi:diacylglycerol kinase